MKVGFTYDLRDDYLAQGYSDEETAEFDPPETIDSIANALNRRGFLVDRIGNIEALTKRLAAGARWDFVFNIAEGLRGSCREAQVPALLEAYGIPCVFSSALVLAVTLDKALTKTILKGAGIATAPWQVVSSFEEIAGVDLSFPLFAKPLSEGSSKGVSGFSMIETKEALDKACRRILHDYNQPALVESFLSGREFTVGVTGTGKESKVIGVMEIFLEGQTDSWGRTASNKKDDHLTPDFYALSSDKTARAAGDLALGAWNAIGGWDAGRIDIRCDSHGVPCVIEINPIAGLGPEYSDLVILAQRAGVSYDALIGLIIDAFFQRTGLTRESRYEVA